MESKLAQLAGRLDGWLSQDSALNDDLPMEAALRGGKEGSNG